MEQVEVILGVDTHLEVRVGAVISEKGSCWELDLSQQIWAVTSDLLNWAKSFGDLRCAGVEGTGTYGAGLARVLLDHNIEVLEVNRPDRSEWRFRGKSDPTDAESAARAVVSGNAAAVPKDKSGAAETMRAVTVARRSAVKAKTQAINQLKGLIVSAPQEGQGGR